MKKVFFMTLFFISFLYISNLSAQSSEMMDRFYTLDHADLGTSTYLILASAGEIKESASVDDALMWLEEESLSEMMLSLDAARNITYGELAYILMEAHSIRGGILYSIIPGPRYAAREAAYRKWIPGKSMAGRFLKPYEVINAVMLLNDEMEEMK